MRNLNFNYRPHALCTIHSPHNNCCSQNFKRKWTTGLVWLGSIIISSFFCFMTRPGSIFAREKILSRKSRLKCKILLGGGDTHRRYKKMIFWWPTPRRVGSCLGSSLGSSLGLLDPWSSDWCCCCCWQSLNFGKIAPRSLQTKTKLSKLLLMVVLSDSQVK